MADDQAEKVRWQRSWRGRAREAFTSGPREITPNLEEICDHPSLKAPDPSQIDEVVRVKKEQLRDGVLARWQELRAVKVAVQDVAEAFGGEDPAVPDVREVIGRLPGAARGAARGRGAVRRAVRAGGAS